LTGALTNAGGTVTYWFSLGSTCSGPYYLVGSPVTVTDGIVPNSQPQNFSTAGSYSWIASYSGDVYDQGAESACEPLTVAGPFSSISTTLSQTIVAVGQPVTGSATLTGVFNAGGTVTYQYFSGSTCSGAPTTVGAPVTVTDRVVPGSAPQTFNTPGDYSWNAVYSGDANNLAATSGCKTLMVNASPTTLTCNPASVVVGSAVTCKATVKGSGSTPTGSVAWLNSSSGKFSKLTCRLLKGACSVKFTPTATGSVLITANYGGDSKYSPSAGTYSLTVTKQNTRIDVLSCKPRSAVAGSSTIITCTVDPDCVIWRICLGITGTVSWSQIGTGSVFFASTTCALTKGECSVTMTGVTAGKVTLQAAYGGDSNNKGSSKTATLTIK